MAENLGHIFPVGDQLGSWPPGGLGASDTSIPSVSGADGPNYWLPIWSGEVLHAYDQYNMFEPMVVTETIESGTTKRFPITGTVAHKGIWNSGEELITTADNAGKGFSSAPTWFDISLDQRPMCAFFDLDDIHSMLSQWDYRAELARQAGLTLANVRDKQIACMIGQAAFTASRRPGDLTTGNYAGMNHTTRDVLPPDAVFNHLGNKNSTADERTNAALKLLEYLELYMVALEEVDVPTGEVYCAVTPQAFQDIRALGVARDSTDLVGGAGRPYFGGVAEAGGLGMNLKTPSFDIMKSLDYMGVKIIKSNHLGKGAQGLHGSFVNSGGTSAAPTFTDGILANDGLIGDLGDAKYDFNWASGSATAALGAGALANPIHALIWQRNGVCSLRFQGMKVETVKDVRRGVYFTVASIMAGAGILRPELCGAVAGIVTLD